MNKKVTKSNNKTKNTEKQEEYFKDTVLANEDIKGVHYPIIFNYLVNSLNRGYAPIVAICGRYGSGKSMSALRIAELLHNKINVLKGDIKPKEQLVYSPLGFLNTIKDSERKAIIFDEGGVNLNSLDFRSSMNRAVIDAVSTQRFKENVYIFVLGKLYKLSKSLRDIIDLRLTCQRRKSKKPHVKGTIFRPKYESLEANNTKKSFYLNEEYRPKLPSKDIREKYREKERKFKKDLIKDRIQELKQEEKTGKSDTFKV